MRLLLPKAASGINQRNITQKRQARHLNTHHKDQAIERLTEFSGIDCYVTGVRMLTFPKQCGERSPKMFTKQLHLEQGVLNAVVTGEFELALAKIQFVEILDEVVQSGETK